MRLVTETGNEELARVFVLELEDGACVECVESIQPPVPREEKWVLILSTLRGCPVQCRFCDAGLSYRGRLTAPELWGQTEFLLRRRFPEGPLPVKRLKIQLARMGDPAFNPAVLEFLDQLPARVQVPVLMPSVSTIAPASGGPFLEELIAIKNRHYAGGRFQMQFSLHCTDPEARRQLVPAHTWSMAQMGAYARRFLAPGDRKITLNFAAVEGYPVEVEALREHFDPAQFCLKFTPVNPTRAARGRALRGMIRPGDAVHNERLLRPFRDAGYDVILSIGELDENQIGSNCGMYLTTLEATREEIA